MNAEVVDADVSMFITLANTCQALNALPRSGGVLDQDSYLMYGIELVINAQAERRQRDERAARASRKH